MDTSLVRRDTASRGLGSIILAAILWGTVGVTTQALYRMTTTNPVSIGFFRLALATPILIIVCRHALGGSAWRIARRDVVLMMLLGAMLGLYQVCYFAAIAYTGVAIATLVTLCTAPVLVAIISVWVLRERITAARILALGCALAGTGFLVSSQSSGMLGHKALIGVLLALGSALGYAVVTICGRLLAGRYHPLQTTTIGFATGALLLLAFAGASGFVIHYPAEGWMLLSYLGIIPTALAYGLFLAGMRTTSATVASIVTLLEPLTATILAWFLFDERLGARGIVGAALLLSAIAVLYAIERQPA